MLGQSIHIGSTLMKLILGEEQMRVIYMKY